MKNVCTYFLYVDFGYLKKKFLPFLFHIWVPVGDKFLYMKISPGWEVLLLFLRLLMAFLRPKSMLSIF